MSSKSKPKSKKSDEQREDLVPDADVWEEFGVTPMTGWRWDRDTELNFPPAIRIKTRKYRSRRQLEEFKRALVREAIAARGKVSR